MAPLSPSIEMFLSKDRGKRTSQHGHLPAISVVSSFDVETDRSYHAIPPNSSMTSFSSQCSNVTTQMSNTTKEHSERKHRRRKFLRFVEVLMGIVREKDERKFRTAKNIVNDWEQQKGLAEVEDLSESLRSPLKHAVGPKFWSEARQRVSQASSHTTKTKRFSFNAATESDTHASEDITVPVQYDDDEEMEEARSSPSSHMLVESSQPCPIQSVATNGVKEMKRRKKRVWMVIRVLMQHLQKKHRHLYHKAHILVNECVREHKQEGEKAQHRKSLSGNIETCLKKEFGSELWKRADNFVSQSLVRRREDRF